ncbi:MAG: T9SS type A sorting domain-containing protein [Candidatus Pollutiaquabacter aromativorans]
MKNFLHLLLLFVLGLFGPAGTNAATYYWVGGSGNWSDYATHWATSSGGSTFHASIPTINDDVVIDAASFTATGQVLNLDSTFYYCNSMSWAGVQFNPTFEGNGATLNLRGSIAFSAGMTLSNVNLVMSATTGSHTIDLAGQYAYAVTIDANASYSLSSPLTCIGPVDLRAGSLNANAFDISCGGFNAGVGTTLVLGDITLSVNGGSNEIFTRTITLDVMPSGADQTSVHFNCVSGEMDCINNTTPFDSLIFQNAATLRACQANYASATNTSYALNSILGTGEFSTSILLENCTINQLNGKLVYLMSGTTSSIYNLNLNSSCSDMGRLSTSYAGAPPATLNAASGTISIDYAILEGIQASGGATFNANNVIDLGGNSGWNISALVTRDLYWVGGTGDWNDPNHWSLSSGGASAGCTPNRLDNVFFDANSLGAGDTVYLPHLEQYAGDLTVNGVTGSPTFFGDYITLYGSLDLNHQMNWRLYQTHLRSPRTGSILRTTGTPFMYLTYGDSCWYTLQDSLYAEWIYQQNGNVDYNGQNVNTRLLSGYPAAQAITANSTFYLKDMYFDGTFIGSATTDIIFDKGPAYCRNNRASQFRNMYFIERGFLSDSVTVASLVADQALDIGNANTIGFAQFYHDVTVSGSNSIDDLRLSNGGFNYSQAPGETLTLGTNLQVQADCNGLAGIRSTVSGTPTNISMTSGSVTVDYVSLNSVAAGGGASFTANNSVDGGNNTGWTINSPAPRTVYWVGGSGNWSDPTHWSLSTGGASGACVPAAIDQVIFDGNSGLASGILTLDVTNVSAAGIDFSAAGSDITVNGTTISVTGDLALAPVMNWNVATTNLLPGASGIDLTSNATELDSVTINGTGPVTLLDACAGIQLQLLNGNLDADGNDITMSRMTSNLGTDVNFGPMTLTVSYFYLQGSLSNSRQADVVMRWLAPVYSSLGYDFRTTGAFRNITVLDIGARFFLNSFVCEQFTAYQYVNVYSQLASDSIRKAIFFDDFAMSGNIVCDTIFLNNPGKTSNLGGNITFSELVCNGTPAFPVFLKGNPIALLNKTSGQVCIANALLQDVTVGGGATFNAGNGCVDLGGNTGWTFAPCTVVSNVWPGDANYDLVCNNSDILDIGVAFGQTGPVRAGATLSWTAQAATDFNGWFVSAVNFKHADCDGDGTVGFADTLAVNQNYGQTHPARLQPTPAQIDAALPPLVIDATPDTVAPGATVNVAIQLGTITQAVDSLYGIAFTVYYDPTVVDTNSLVTDFSTSWLGTAGVDLITFYRHTPSAGRIDFALVRNDGQNVFGGFGDIALFDVVIVDNISTLTDALFTPGNLRAITASQFPLLFGSQNDRVVLDPTLTRVPVPDLSTRFVVFPNPAAHTVIVRSKDIQVMEVALFDLGGQCVFRDQTGQAETRIAVDAIALGIYQLRVVTDAGVYNKKIEVLRR